MRSIHISVLLGLLTITCVYLFPSVGGAQEETDEGALDDDSYFDEEEGGEEAVGEEATEAGEDATALEGQQDEANEENKGSKEAEEVAERSRSKIVLRLMELEQRVNDLKERIFQSKSRLVLLKATVLHGTLSGSQVELIHVNEMGSEFELKHAVYSLNGEQIFNESDHDGSLADEEEIVIRQSPIVPGAHNLSLMLEYQGSGFGVFSYLEGYKFKIQSSHTFTAEEGKTIKIRVVAYEKGNFTTAMEDRPDIRYEIEMISNDDEELVAETADEAEPADE